MAQMTTRRDEEGRLVGAHAEVGAHLLQADVKGKRRARRWHDGRTAQDRELLWTDGVGAERRKG